MMPFKENEIVQQQPLLQEQDGEQSNVIDFKQCSICGITEQSSQMIIIMISIQQKYCENCLQQQLTKENQIVKNMQERYIYQKQYQSRFNEDTKQSIFPQYYNTQQYQQYEIKLKKLTQEELQLNKKIKKSVQDGQRLKQQILIMENQQDKFWQAINKFQKRAIKLEEKTLCAKTDKTLIDNEMQKIQKMSILHEIFDINIEDNISYVQGMTMGKRSNLSEINWQEVQIGLGHLFLALNFLHLKYVEHKYTHINQIILKGNLTIISLKNNISYSIIYNKQNQKKFGQILQIFLKEISELQNFLEIYHQTQSSQKYALPYPIDKINGKIMGLYVDPNKIQQKSEKNKWTIWTKTMRYLLINFKHILTICVINDRYL